jgi:hypothetical protein
MVLLLAHVQAAVLQQHHLARRDREVAVNPPADQAHRLAEQLGQARGHGLQRILGLELALGGTTQVRGDHDGRARVECQADGGHAGADARVFGDTTLLVLRHVEVGADEDALALDAALGTEIGEADEGGHVGNPGVRWTNPGIVGNAADAPAVPGTGAYQPRPMRSGR